MFPNPQEALPLPPQPNLESYKKTAKDLVKACKSNRPDAIRTWSEQWIRALIKLSGLVSTPERPISLPQWIDEVADFARRKLSDNEMSMVKCALTKAQFVIARSHGFESWPKFTEHLKAIARNDSSVSRFEAAADAIVAGDIATVKRLLREEPELIYARSTREHGATLLHYVSANGVEGYRQKTPRNIVEITRVLLEAGADVDATASVYRGDCTALGLVATSVHPEQAGVQISLLQTLLDHGAAIDRPCAGGNSSLLHSCLANGQPKAAEFLESRGAPLDLIAAAGLGRLTLVKDHFDEEGKRRSHVTAGQVVAAYFSACWWGQTEVVEFLLGTEITASTTNAQGQTGLHCAAYGAYVNVIRLLLQRGSPVDVKEKQFHATPLDVALWVWNNSRDPERRERCYELINLLARAGAKLDPKQWQKPGADEPSPMLERIRSDLRMLRALRGEIPG